MLSPASSWIAMIEERGSHEFTQYAFESSYNSANLIKGSLVLHQSKAPCLRLRTKLIKYMATILIDHLCVS